MGQSANSRLKFAIIALVYGLVLIAFGLGTAFEDWVNGSRTSLWPMILGFVGLVLGLFGFTTMLSQRF
jgi:hypothetical protein